MSIPSARKVMVLNASYSLTVIRLRKIEFRIQAAALDGYFENAWSVNAVVGADPSTPIDEAYGRTTFAELAPGHTVVEGKVGRYLALRRVAPLNFVLAQLHLFAQLSRLIRRERISVIRADDPFYHGLIGWALARLHGIPFEVRLVANYDEAYEQYGYIAYPRLLRTRRVAKLLDRFVLRRADLVTAGSENNRGYAIQNGVRPERLGEAGNANMIDPVHRREPDERTSVAVELGLEGRPFLISLGRLETAKHPGDLVHVLAKARVEIPSLALVFVGDGSMYDQIQELVDEMGLRDHVVFAGDRDQHWIGDALATASVVLSPLTGLALVEAALSATPIVAYDVEWQPEFIASGRTGLIVPYRDTSAMAAAAVRLVREPDFARRIGEAGRAHALAFRDPAAQNAKETALYDQLLGARLSPR